MTLEDRIAREVARQIAPLNEVLNQIWAQMQAEATVQTARMRVVPITEISVITTEISGERDFLTITRLGPILSHQKMCASVSSRRRIYSGERGKFTICFLMEPV